MQRTKLHLEPPLLSQCTPFQTEHRFPDNKIGKKGLYNHVCDEYLFDVLYLRLKLIRKVLNDFLYQLVHFHSLLGLHNPFFGDVNKQVFDLIS